MKAISEELLWKYIDGDCSDEEKQMIEAALEKDETLKQSMAERKALHLALQNIEEEVPSMRFATNVMENLPKKVWRWKPLLTPRLAGRFIFGLVSGTTICFLLAFTAAPNVNAVSQDPVIGQLSQWSNQFFASSFSNMIILITLGVAILYALDQYLKKRFRVN